MEKIRINGDYGKFIIRQRKRTSIYYQYEIVANHFQTVTSSIDEAVNYLIDRFGRDVVYEVKIDK